MRSLAILTFHALRKLCPGICKSVRECTVDYLLSNKSRTRDVQKVAKPIVKLPVRTARGCNHLFSSMEGDQNLTGTHVPFLIGWLANETNPTFTKAALREMLEDETSRMLNTAFSFLSLLINRSTGNDNSVLVVEVQIRFNEIVVDATGDMQ